MSIQGTLIGISLGVNLSPSGEVPFERFRARNARSNDDRHSYNGNTFYRAAHEGSDPHQGLT